MSKTRIAELERALEPFARYAAYLAENPFCNRLPDDMPIFGLPLAPTIGDLKRARKALPNVDVKLHPPELRRATTGTSPPFLGQ